MIEFRIKRAHFIVHIIITNSFLLKNYSISNFCIVVWLQQSIATYTPAVFFISMAYQLFYNKTNKRHLNVGWHIV